jgi:hypothetical protein
MDVSMTALSSEADICAGPQDVCVVPIPDRRRSYSMNSSGAGKQRQFQSSEGAEVEFATPSAGRSSELSRDRPDRDNRDV